MPAARPSAVGQPQQPRPGPSPTTLYAIPVSPNDDYLGAKNAKVTIVEAFDFA